MREQKRWEIARLVLAAASALWGCDGAAAAGASVSGVDAGADVFSSVNADERCATAVGQGTVCSGGRNDPGITGTSLNNQGVVGNSTSGRGVYGSSVRSEGGYFSSTDGDGVLAYSANGFAGHFVGGRGVIIDPPSVGGAALAVSGMTRTGLGAAGVRAVPVCGALDAESGLFTLSKCDDRLDRLEADVSALKTKLATLGVP